MPTLPDCILIDDGPPCPGYLALKTEMDNLDAYPGVNEDLIRKMVTEGNADWLIALFNFNNRAKHRAEKLAQAYFNQMEILHKRLEIARGSQPQPDRKSPQLPAASRLKAGPIETKAQPTKIPEPDLAIDL